MSGYPTGYVEAWRGVNGGTYGPSVSASRSSVAGSTSSTVLLTSKGSRKGATVFNDSASTLYLGLGSDAVSTSSFTVVLDPFGYYEAPYGYAGEIRGIWVSATGNARITELL